MSDEVVPSDIVPCPSCGGLNPEDANFCQVCGESMGSVEYDAGSETVAFSTEDVKRLGQVVGTAHPNGDGDGLLTAFKTDIGRKHRVNQDSGGAWSWERADGTVASLLIVADGVSAGRNSEGASKLAVEVVYDRVAAILQDESIEPSEILRALVEAIKEANHQIAARPHVAVTSADATTIVAAFVIDTVGGGAWVGDSRIYRVSGDTIERLTVDHSWAQGVVSRGLMSEEQAARDPRAHMIMRWLGPPDQDDPGVETFKAVLEPGDIVFCCTDGLYMYFAPPVAREEEMVRVFAAHPDSLSGAIEQLIDSALARGGYDNITVAALRVPSEERGVDEADSLAASRHAREDTVQFRFPQ